MLNLLFLPTDLAKSRLGCLFRNILFRSDLYIPPLLVPIAAKKKGYWGDFAPNSGFGIFGQWIWPPGLCFSCPVFIRICCKIHSKQNTTLSTHSNIPSKGDLLKMQSNPISNIFFSWQRNVLPLWPPHTVLCLFFCAQRKCEAWPTTNIIRLTE